MSSKAYPIPAAALDDRLAFTGIPGSGKTYNCGTAVERLLKAKSRVCIVDPLGVWWGLRLRADGEPSPFKIVIFGGRRGDIAITPTSGRIIGETVAQMAESCIVDLSEFDTEAEQRRFMLAFVMGAYARLAGELLHLVLDEADMWVPQQIRDKDGDAAKLHHHVQKIVRRGRVKGFIPWLITQRPAEISKSVLSMCAGIVAGNLTSPQDVGAMMDWVGKRADPSTAKLIEKGLPSFRQGEAAVYIPARRVLAIGRFPTKTTFDSSKAPERGENRSAIALKPLDLGALRTRLAKVETEAKVNDPAALKARIVELERTARAPTPAPGATPAQVAAAEQRGYERGWTAGVAIGADRGVRVGWNNAVMASRKHAEGFLGRMEPDRLAAMAEVAVSEAPSGKASATVARTALESDKKNVSARAAPAKPAARSNGQALAGDGAITVTGPQRQILKSIAFWTAMGHPHPRRAQVAAIAGWRITSGHLKNVAGSLSSAGLVTYPSPGLFALTDAGAAAAPEPDLGATLIASLSATLTGPQRSALEALLAANGRSLNREELARDCGWAPTSGHVKNVVGSLSSLEIVEYPSPGVVALQDWVR